MAHLQWNRMWSFLAWAFGLVAFVLFVTADKDMAKVHAWAFVWCFGAFLLTGALSALTAERDE